MKYLVSLTLVTCLSLVGFTGCNPETVTGPKVAVEEIDSYKPNLPTVPTIQKPTVPETYPDGSYSVYGARKNLAKTIETEINITAYIADMYKKPECDEDKACFKLMPHLFLADIVDEKVERRRIKVVGYAKSFKEMEDQAEKAAKGKIEELPEGVYLPPIVYDWQQGHKYKIKARYTRASSDGFMATDGLLDYKEHECLDCPVDEEREKK